MILKELQWLFIEVGKQKIFKYNMFRIPAALKDRRTRPHDFNSGKQETILGTLRRTGNNTHNFKEPNDPSFNLWKNFSLEDFAIYWQLPNRNDAKYVYFQVVDFGSSIGNENNNDIYPIKTSIQDVIVENGKEKRLKLDRNYNLISKVTGSLSAVFSYLFYLSL